MTVMVTGHRPERLRGQEKEVSAGMAALIAELKPDKVISGMAAGADQIWAIAALDSGIPLYCYFPYPRKRYHPQEQYIVENAAGILNICSEYSPQSYYLRDKAMVDDSDVVIAVWDGVKSGGTWKTIEYAKSQGKDIRYIMIEVNK